MSDLLEPWHVDPDDPRAPTKAIWARMSEAERATVVASLPTSWESMAEGDEHFDPMVEIRDTLRRYFNGRGRDAYVGSDMAVYYPDETKFAPDAFVVLDVEPHKRSSWIVSRENDRGLDVVIEIHVGGDRTKDFERNVRRYARLGIPEYYVFEPLRPRLSGYHLTEGADLYARLVPQGGRFESPTLGLDLMVLDGRLRFMVADSPLPTTWDLNRRLNRVVNELTIRAEEETRLREEETRLREEETRLREEAERRLEEALRRLQELEKRDR